MERLQFVEDRLFWVGRVGSADLRRRFDISKAQAAQDIAKYRDVQDAPINYDTRLKSFVAPPDLRPICGAQSLDRFLKLAEQDDFGEGEVLDLAFLTPPGRKMDLAVAQSVVRAMMIGEEVEVEYISLSSGLGRRWLAPHALASDGMRVHLRAYDHRRGRFADFVMGRIRSVLGRRPRTVDPDGDAEWFDIIHLDLIANPLLPEDRRQAVMADYGFSGDSITYPIRRSMLIYLNTRLLLHSELASMPHAELYRHLVPRDQAAYDALLESIRTGGPESEGSGHLLKRG
jgi:hypothetical protein